MVARNHTQRKMELTRRVPGTTQAVLNTLTPKQGAKGKPSDDRTLELNKDSFDKESKRISQDIVDADAIYQQLPDIELVEQVLVGSIISPKDMSTVQLNFTVEEGRFDTEIVGGLLEIVKQHFKTDYKIDDRLDEMLTRCLFKKGADIYVVIPENNLDQLINGTSRLSMEDFRKIESRYQLDKPLGILGHPTSSTVSMESWNGPKTVSNIGRTFNLSVSDNFDILKQPIYASRKRSTQINSLLGKRSISMESASKGFTAKDIDKLYKEKNEYQEQQVSQTLIPSAYQTRPSVGHCFVMNPSMESMIPVHVPGDPTDHVGYFMIIDPENGRFITRDKSRDYYGEIRDNFSGGSSDGSSELVQMTREAMGGNANTRNTTPDELQNAYATIVENDLINRLRNGIYGEEFEIGFSREIYSIMLARALKKKGTQLIYLPAEFVVYMAFDFDEHGVGQSLLKQTSLLSSMRSVLLFADTMRGVRSAIGRKQATINVDAADPDPQRTISDIQSMILEGVRRGFPLGSPDPAQTMDFLQRSGFDFAINIEGDNYPGTSVEYDDYQVDAAGGNTELEEKLRRLQISGFGMNPEQVDPTQSPDFATSVVNNNLVMTRRVLRYQKRFTGFLSRLVRLITTHSPKLREEIDKAFKEKRGSLTEKQKKEVHADLVEDFIEAIEVTLPSPDTTKIDMQLQSFEQYTQLLDRTLEAYINPDIFPDDYLAREPDTVTRVIAVIRAYFQRLWLERNNVTPELLQLVEMEGRKPNFNLLDVQKVLTGSLGKAIQKYLDGMEKDKEKNEKKYGDSGEDAEGGEFGEADGEEGTDEFGEGAEGEEGGDTDFGEGDDLGEGDEEGAETADATDPEETDGENTEEGEATEGDETDFGEEDPLGDDTTKK